MASWIGNIVTAITTTFTDLGNAIFSMLKDGFTTLFLETNESGAVTGVSNFGIFGFILMGISLCLGLTYFIVNLVRRKM